ncbi:hypothetical protein Ct61P_10014 [Colletotrichum tofieldiae]|nr:hypothetical protein Ct61P_10014 [Colletotrichum tofieldiae]
MDHLEAKGFEKGALRGSSVPGARSGLARPCNAPQASGAPSLPQSVLPSSLGARVLGGGRRSHISSTLKLPRDASKRGMANITHCSHGPPPLQGMKTRRRLCSASNPPASADERGEARGLQRDAWTV